MTTLRLQIGTVVGNGYRVLRALSEGGMGAVYVAEHVPTKKERALKIMHAELVGSAKLRERFVQEAQIGSRIRSEHIVETTDAGIDAALGLPWLAMELLEGETLAARCARGPIDAQTVRTIFGQLCHAIAAAHDAGVVHRDLKPENIFLARSNRDGPPWSVKVLDFGIAKLLTDAKKSATGALGTPLYMPPEQMSPGREVTPAADVWALGLIAFHLLTGKDYWLSADEDSSPMMVLNEVVNLPLVPASQRAAELRAPSVPAGFDAWFARCVSRDPRTRFQHARELRSALEAILPAPGSSQSGLTIGAAPTAFALHPSASQAAPRARGKVPIAVYVASAVAVLTIAAVAAFAFVRDGLGSASSSRKPKSTKAVPEDTAPAAPSVSPPPVPSEKDPCPPMAVCHPVAFPDPKAVELDLVLQRALEFLRAERPTAELATILLQRAVHGSVIDLTLPAAPYVLLYYNVAPGSGASVAVGPTRLEAYFYAHSGQLPPLTLNAACDLKKALETVGAAGFPLAALDTVQVVSARLNDVTWNIQSKADIVSLDGQTCRVRTKSLRH